MFFVKLLMCAGMAFCVTFLLIPFFCWLAYIFRLVDEPDGVIKKHERAIPNLGGLAVYFGFISACSVCVGHHSYEILLCAGLTLLLFVGLIDDKICLKPYQKFLGQFIASIFFLTAGVHFKDFFSSHALAIFLSLLWILTIINAFNLIDVMDGLATTVALCATATFLIISVWVHEATVSVALAAFFGSLAAFLWYNKPSARIYLGDAGALFVGGFLAIIPFLLPWTSYSLYGYLAPIVILALPLLEITTLIAVRTYKKIPFYRPSPDHFCLYLLRNGWTKVHILWYVIGMSILLSAASLLLFFGLISLFAVVCAAVGFLAVWFFVLTHHVSC